MDACNVVYAYCSNNLSIWSLANADSYIILLVARYSANHRNPSPTLLYFFAVSSASLMGKKFNVITLSKTLIAIGRTFAISSGVCTLAMLMEARLQTTVSPAVYFMLTVPSSSISSMNFEGEVF